MKRIIPIIITLILATSVLTACQKQESNRLNKLQIAVSIVPQETFVKAVAGELVDVVTLIPPGASPENYQPTPRQMTELSKSRLYFSIGTPTEDANIMPNIEDMNQDIEVIELAKIVDAVYPPRYFEEEHEEEEKNHDHAHEGRDPHIWMSPKRVIVMIEAIQDSLSNIDPANQEIYKENATNYIESLQSLDEEIQATMDQMENKTFIIMHPSIGYFADDYGLEMIALEEEGKEKTASRLRTVIDYAKQEDIKVVFYQAEFDNQQAKTLASEIQGEALEVKPLAPNYIESLTEMNEVFQRVLK